MQAAGPAATFRAEGYRKQDTLLLSNQSLLHSMNKKPPCVSSPHLLFSSLMNPETAKIQTRQHNSGRRTHRSALLQDLPSRRNHDLQASPQARPKVMKTPSCREALHMETRTAFVPPSRPEERLHAEVHRSHQDRQESPGQGRPPNVSPARKGWGVNPEEDPSAVGAALYHPEQLNCLRQVEWGTTARRWFIGVSSDPIGGS